MNTAKHAEAKDAAVEAVSSPDARAPKPPPSADAGPTDDFISALTGLEANRTNAVAHRTRRVVVSSQGVLQEQKRGGNRTRSFALAGTIVLLLLLAPLACEASEDFFEGERTLDTGAQLAVWGLIACAAMLAAALVAGWMRRRDRD